MREVGGTRSGIVKARVFLKEIHKEDTSPSRELEICVSIITTNGIGGMAGEFVMEPPQAMKVKVGHVRWVPLVALLNKWCDGGCKKCWGIGGPKQLNYC